MTDTISSVIADPTTIAADDVSLSVISATVLTDDAPAGAGIDVTWTVAGNGQVTQTSSITDDQGIAVTEVKAFPGTSGLITVTASVGFSSKNAYVTVYNPLPAPYITNATGETPPTLDHYDLQSLVQVSIPIYSTLALGQKINFKWGNVDGLEFVVSETTRFPYIIDIKESLSPSCLMDGTYNIQYIVTDNAGNTTPSIAVPLTVKNSGSVTPTLAPPSVPAADPYINLSEAQLGVDVIVAPYTNMQIDDEVTLYWVGQNSDLSLIDGTLYTELKRVDNVAQPLAFVIPPECFFPNAVGYEGRFTCNYKVKKSDQEALVISYDAIGLVDSKPAK